MIEIANLRVQRGDQTICAVEQLSVAVGERVAVLGDNGSGKTTLLRVIAGLIDDYTGTCRVDVDSQRMTYVHQQPYLFRGTVLSNARYRECSATEQGRSGQDWLERLQVAHLANQPTADLSGGERRRVALARALATQPRLLLLDEPLADLDDAAQAIVSEVLTELRDTTILIASPTKLPTTLTTRSLALTHVPASA